VNLLLDTHCLLWAAAGADRLPPAMLALIETPASRLWFSAASIWEVAIKRGLNRPDFQTDPGTLRAGLLSAGYEELPVEGRHVLILAALPPLHRDPFDRMLVAQATSEGMRLLTADRRLLAYGGAVLDV
jgi:PIN domain nuclease of toxin-antitoxin system